MMTSIILAIVSVLSYSLGRFLCTSNEIDLLHRLHKARQDVNEMASHNESLNIQNLRSKARIVDLEMHLNKIRTTADMCDETNQ